MPDIDQFTALGDRLVDRIPPQFLRELNGGIIVSGRVRRQPDAPPGVYTLAEYRVEPGLGRFIVLYYGSFRRALEGRPRREVEEELWETLLHEVRHHLESLAGVDELGKEDLEQLLEFWRRYREGGT
ncbi:MAG: metallopeptidase family protein [Acetobacteraceae bacterium]|nr:metallopeptidase family protein [Acetobacteraceae bacterium]